MITLVDISAVGSRMLPRYDVREAYLFKGGGHALELRSS